MSRMNCRKPRPGPSLRTHGPETKGDGTLATAKDCAGQVCALVAFCFLCAGWSANRAQDWSGFTFGMAQFAEAWKYHEKEKKMHKESMHQNDHLQKEAVRIEQEHMLRELKSDMKNHMEEISVELREAGKESDRDNWEQRHSMCQTLLVGAAIMLAAACSVIVEGIANMPWEIEDSIVYEHWFQVTFAVFLALSFGCLFLCILLSIIATRRMSMYMQQRADTQRQIIGRVYSQHDELTKRFHRIRFHSSVDAKYSPYEGLMDSLIGGKQSDSVDTEPPKCPRARRGAARSSFPTDSDSDGEGEADEAQYAAEQRKEWERWAADWKDLHAKLTEQVCVRTGPEPHQAFLNFSEYYEANVRLLSECGTTAFIMGIGTTIGVLVLIFVAHFSKEGHMMLSKWVFVVVTTALTVAGLLAFGLDWKYGELPWFGRNPSMRDDEQAFTFQPAKIRANAMEMYDDIRFGRRRSEPEAKARAEAMAGRDKNQQAGLSVDTEEQDRIRLEEVWKYFQNGGKKRRREQENHKADPNKFANDMDYSEFADHINRERQEEQVLYKLLQHFVKQEWGDCENSRRVQDWLTNRSKYRHAAPVPGVAQPNYSKFNSNIGRRQDAMKERLTKGVRREEWERKLITQIWS